MQVVNPEIVSVLKDVLESDQVAKVERFLSKQTATRLKNLGKVLKGNPAHAKKLLKQATYAEKQAAPVAKVEAETPAPEVTEAPVEQKAHTRARQR